MEMGSIGPFRGLGGDEWGGVTDPMETQHSVGMLTKGIMLGSLPWAKTKWTFHQISARKKLGIIGLSDETMNRFMEEVKIGTVT